MEKIPRFKPPVNIQELTTVFHRTENNDACGFFANSFAEYIGVRHAISTPSARTALLSILKAMDFPSGSEIILPALTFHSVPQVIVTAGYRPRFVDIKPDTYCLDPAQIEAAVGPKTVAVIPTHLYGRACNMAAIGKIATEHGLRIIEDCAQSCGGYYGQQRLGSLGDASFFSFGPTKNLSTLWSGMAITNSPELAKRIERYIQDLSLIPAWQLAKRIFFTAAMIVSTNQSIWRWCCDPLLRLAARFGVDPIEKLTTENAASEKHPEAETPWLPGKLQARLGLSQLRKLDTQNERRHHNGTRLLTELKGISTFELPATAAPMENIFMSFPVRISARDLFRQRLFKLGVDTAVGYMSCCPDLPTMKEFHTIAPVARRAVAQMVHLPVYPELTSAQIDWMVQSLRRIV